MIPLFLIAVKDIGTKFTNGVVDMLISCRRQQQEGKASVSFITGGALDPIDKLMTSDAFTGEKYMNGVVDGSDKSLDTNNFTNVYTNSKWL
jgi:hypothetical protein